MRLTKSFILTVIVSSVLFGAIQADQHYNPDKIVGVWNVIAVLHSHSKDTPFNERCIRLTFVKVGTNIFTLTRNVIHHGKRVENEWTVKINDTIMQNIPKNADELPRESTIMDFDDENEMVIFSHHNSIYIMISRGMSLSKKLTDRYLLFSKFEWTLKPVQHENC